jgi:hypothetical protein
LILGVDVVCLHAPFLQIVPNEVILHSDVLATIMEDWFL